MIYLVLSLHFCRGLLSSHAGFLYYIVFTTVWQLSHHGGSTIQNTTNVNDAGRLSEETSVYIGVCGSASLHPSTTHT